MNPTPGDVHVNQPLTDISVAFIQKATNYVADKVFPNISVSKQSDLYYTYDRAYFNKSNMEVRAPSTESAGAEFKVDATPNYFAPVHALHHDIDDQRRANADSVLDLDREATELLTGQAFIRREKLWVSKYFAGGLWTGDVDGVASAENNTTTFRQWNDAASDPINNVRKGKSSVLQSTGFEPNTLVIGQAVWDALVDHPDIVDRVKYGQTAGGAARVNIEALKALFEVDNIHIMKAVENTAATGQTATHAFIGGKKALLCYSAPTPGIMTPTAGYTFSWTGYTGAAGAGQRIKKFRMENLSSDRVEIEMAFDQKLVAADLGYFFDTIVA